MRRSAPALLVIALLAIPARADHSWNGYHWARTTTSFDLRVVDSVTSGWQFAFEESLSRWGSSSKLNNVVASVAEDSKTRKRCPTVSGQMRVCNAAYGQNGWLGLAAINLDANGHVIRGVAKMNDSYDWYFAQVPGEANHVMCQEIGHTFGLDHQDENFEDLNLGSCMDYTNNQAGPPSNEHPNAHDFDELDSIYSHFDTPASPGGNGPGRGRGNGLGGFGMTRAEQTRALLGTIQALDPGEWGRLIRQHGRFAVFDLDLGNDTHLMTFVIWA